VRGELYLDLLAELPALPLPLSGSGEFTCPHTGDRYRLEGASLVHERA
jgi:hypothetical protein